VRVTLVAEDDASGGEYAHAARSAGLFALNKTYFKSPRSRMQPGSNSPLSLASIEAALQSFDGEFSYGNQH
jgi:hypothetical protein